MSTAVDLVGAPRRIPNMGRGRFNANKEGNTAKRDELEKKLRKELEKIGLTSKWEERCRDAKIEDMDVILACLEIEKHRKEEMSIKYEEEIEKCKKLEVKVSNLEVNYAVLEDNLSYLVSHLDEERKTVSEWQKEKADLTNLLEEERSKVSELQGNVSEYIDMVAKLENKKTDLADQLEEERSKVSEYIDTIANLEKEKTDLADQLEEERCKASELQDRLIVLEDSEHELRKQCAELQEGKLNVDSNLEDEEWPIVSKFNDKYPENVLELEDKCATLEEENGNLGYYLDCERQNNTVLGAEKASLQSDKEKLWEMLSQFQADIGAERQRQWELSRELEDKRAALEEAQRSVKQFEFADEELNKKVSKLEKKCLKLKEEKKVWAAEKESLVMSLNSQASVVEAYRDMLNKEECLVKLFQNS